MYLDCDTEIMLDSGYLDEKNLSVGMHLTEQEADLLIRESDYRRAKSRALYYLSISDLSRKGLITKLKKAGFTESSCNRAAERMEELSLINDAAYAERLSQSLADSNISRREAINKMILKGIDRDTAREYIDKTAADPKEQIRSIVNRKYSSRLGTPDEVKKIFAALARKGFEFSDIRSVLREYDGELDTAEE